MLARNLDRDAGDREHRGGAARAAGRRRIINSHIEWRLHYARLKGHNEWRLHYARLRTACPGGATGRVSDDPNRCIILGPYDYVSKLSGRVISDPNR